MDQRMNGVQNPQHYFGTLVVLSVAIGRDEIIDGQQRLTTISVLLGVVQNSIRKLEERCLALERANAANKAQADHYKQVAQSCDVTASPILNLLQFQDGFEDAKVIYSPRLLVSPEIRQTYQSFINGGDGEVASEKRTPATNLRKIAKYFRDEVVEPEIKKDDEPLELLRHFTLVLEILRDSLIVVRLDTPAAGAAAAIFESLNARGVALNTLDLLKVWMMASISQAQVVNTEISAAMREMASDNVDRQLEFFEDFYQARTRKTPKKGISSSNPKVFAIDARRDVFKDPMFNFGPQKLDVHQLVDRIKFEVEYMKKLTPMWFALRNLSTPGNRVPPVFKQAPKADWLSNRLNSLLEVLRHQAGYPFLMVAADALKDEPQKFIELVHVLEKFFFRYRSICGRPEKKIVAAYASFLNDIEANGTLNLQKVKSDLRDLLMEEAPDELFKRNLVEKLDYSVSSRRNLIKYFFEMLDEYSGDPSPRMRPGKLNLGAWHLEHIVPQNPADGDPTLGIAELHSLGNLCILDPAINTRLSALNFAEKKKEAKRLKNLTGIDQINISVADSAKIFYDAKNDVWSGGPNGDVENRIKMLQDFACQVFNT
jgi:hypothetical protein